MKRLSYYLIFVLTYAFSSIAIADHHNNVVVEDPIVVESDFDLNETYGGTQDYSEIDPLEGSISE